LREERPTRISDAERGPARVVNDGERQRGPGGVEIATEPELVFEALNAACDRRIRSRREDQGSSPPLLEHHPLENELAVLAEGLHLETTLHDLGSRLFVT